MQVVSANEWVSDSEYLPIARINKPITHFCEVFQAATAQLKSGTPGLRFRSNNGQFILREVEGENMTELLIPVIDATKTARSAGKVEDSFILAMRDLKLNLSSLTSFHKALNEGRIEYRMGFGLRAKATMDFTPFKP